MNKTKVQNLYDSIKNLKERIELGWWNRVIEDNPHPATNDKVEELRQELIQAQKSIEEYLNPDFESFLKTTLWHHPERTGKVIRELCLKHGFKHPDDAIYWVLENQPRPYTWEFNDSNRPKFWFGDRVYFFKQNLKGTICGMEWRDEESETILTKGWWYRIRWDGKISLQGVHENSLVPLS